MNQTQIHLALTHVPVILSLTGLVVLVISLVRKNITGTRIAFYILLAAGLFSLPVFFSGEGAEEAVEELPGVSETIIEKHENIAGLSLWFILGTGFLSLIGLLKIAGKQLVRVAKFAVLALAFVTAGLMFYTAHLGGQIRHTEIQGALAMNSEGEEGEQASVNNRDSEEDNEQEEDD